MRSQAIRMYKYTATSWLFTSVAKDLNADDREQMQRDSNPGPPDCECKALTTRPRCLYVSVGTSLSGFSYEVG